MENTSYLHGVQKITIYYENMHTAIIQDHTDEKKKSVAKSTQTDPTRTQTPQLTSDRDRPNPNPHCMTTNVGPNRPKPVWPHLDSTDNQVNLGQYELNGAG